ncbi:MAG TPA: flavodoxin family protein [Lachnospiraceae bacterium]|nr:flavodoxin family protein [Lachnospiraceae bacterium]
MKCEVIFDSKTGNTRALAKEFYKCLACGEKEIQELCEETDPEQGEVYFVGFWTDRGTCSMEVIDFLSKLQGKYVALFGTCGMGNNPEYYRDIENRVKVWLPEDNQYLGCFICQGKMPIQVRKRYETLLEEGNQREMAERMLRNFDEVMLHPDSDDFKKAAEFVEKVFKKIR